MASEEETMTSELRTFPLPHTMTRVHLLDLSI